jgi:hypothetical protein
VKDRGTKSKKRKRRGRPGTEEAGGEKRKRARR